MHGESSLALSQSCGQRRASRAWGISHLGGAIHADAQGPLGTTHGVLGTEVGKGGGQIKTGRVLDYLGKPNRKMCSLYMSLLEKAGLRLDSFGDSKQKLAEI